MGWLWGFEMLLRGSMVPHLLQVACSVGGFWSVLFDWLVGFAKENKTH